MEEIIKDIELNKKKFIEESISVTDSKSLTELKSKYLKTYIKTLYGSLKTISDSQNKKLLGKTINDLKLFLETQINELNKKFEKAKDVIKYDTTIFKNNIKYGTVHPLIKFYKKMEKILVNMGFSVVQGPEIELDKYNFEKLNMPFYHPARDMQDTFYVTPPNVLLRSHTSSVQIRTMEKFKPPIQIISPGAVYRVDSIDPQHTPVFYQVEGLVVGEKISFANLKAVLITLLKKVFGDKTKVRFRPSYYPYTEPSAAIDMSCTECQGKGCRVCSQSGWITILGSGMVHPNVLAGVGYDTQKYTGFAFGLGLNRLALLYYGLGEIKKIYENDISLWNQL